MKLSEETKDEIVKWIRLFLHELTYRTSESSRRITTFASLIPYYRKLPCDVLGFLHTCCRYAVERYIKERDLTGPVAKAIFDTHKEILSELDAAKLLQKS